MILPISKYSTTTIDGYDEPAIIYPAYFTLKQAAIVRFPPTCDTTQIKAYEPPLHAYDTLNNIQLDEFAYGFPSGFNLCPLPAPGPAGLPTISTAKPLDFRSAVTLHIFLENTSSRADIWRHTKFDLRLHPCLRLLPTSA